MVKNKEDKFYKALEEIFLGTEIEGDSGYINLLKIKSNYYKIILKEFKEKIDSDELVSDVFREELFDQLYSFFYKYFSESGSVYFLKTANWQRVYEKVYSDNDDVTLFWKTHMLYSNPYLLNKEIMSFSLMHQVLKTNKAMKKKK